MTPLPEPWFRHLRSRSSADFELAARNSFRWVPTKVAHSKSLMSDDPLAAAAPAAAEKASGGRPRRGGVEVASDKVSTATASLERARNQKMKHAAAAAAAGTAKAREKCEAAERTADAAITKAQAKVEAAEQELAAARSRQEDKEKAAKEKAEVAATKAEVAKDMSPEGARLLVQLRLERDHLFSGKAVKNDNLWDEIADAYNAAVDAGKLPAGDRRPKGQASLKPRYSKEKSWFAAYCNKLAAAKQSGADRKGLGARAAAARAHKRPPESPLPAPRAHCSADTTATTPLTETIQSEYDEIFSSRLIFEKHQMHNKAGIVAPFTIDGETAEDGGAANPFLDGLLESDDEGEEGEEEDEDNAGAAGAEDDEDDEDEGEGEGAEEDDGDGDGAEGDGADEEGAAGSSGAAPSSSAGKKRTARPHNIGGTAKKKHRPKQKKMSQREKEMRAFMGELLEADAKAAKAEREAAKKEEAAREEKDRKFMLDLVKALGGGSSA